MEAPGGGAAGLIVGKRAEEYQVDDGTLDTREQSADSLKEQPRYRHPAAWDRGNRGR